MRTALVSSPSPPQVYMGRISMLLSLLLTMTTAILCFPLSIRCCASRMLAVNVRACNGLSRLRLRLAGGEIELVRGVLWQLKAALGQELLRRAISTANANNQGAGDSNDTSSAPREIALANYLEATELLVVQIMLPCGESTEASVLVSKDTHLRAKDKIRLLKECELSAIRTVGGDESDIATVGGAVRGTSSNRAAGSGDSHSHQGRARRAATGGPDNLGHTRFDSLEPLPDGSSSTAQHEQQQQGSVLKLFSHASDWTPEARIQLVVGAGVAGLAAYAALRNRDSLWRATRTAVGVAARTAGDIGAFIVGSS